MTRRLVSGLRARALMTASWLACRLPEGPLFRSRIVLLDANSAAVVLTGHHVICDGWSLDVLIHDLCAFYSEELSGTPAQLRPAGSYADYASGVGRLDGSGGSDPTRLKAWPMSIDGPDQADGCGTRHMVVTIGPASPRRNSP